MINRYRQKLIDNHVILISTYIWGILAHGAVIFNRFSIFDDLIYEFSGVGNTFSFGRWMSALLMAIVRVLLGGDYSIDPFNEIIALTFIGITSCILCYMFRIASTAGQICLSGIMVMYPTITSLFGGYLCCAFYFTFAILLGVYAAYSMCCSDRRSHHIVAVLCIAMSLGIYQAYFPLIISVVYLYFYIQVIREDYGSRQIVILGGRYLLVLMGGAALYVVINQICLTILGIQMRGYIGMDTYGITDVYNYYWRIRRAYSEFFNPTLEEQFIEWNMYRGPLRGIYYAILVWNGGCVVSILHHKDKWQSKLWIILLTVLFPLVINSIFCISGLSVYSLMTYSGTIVFVAAIILPQYAVNNGQSVIRRGGVILVGVACILYWRYDNICYLKEEMILSQMNAYATTLITRIESTDGYTDDLPVVFIHNDQKQDANWPDIEELDIIDIRPFEWNGVISDNSFPIYLANWCGFAPTYLDSDEWEYKDEVVQMPVYPDEGAIRIVDEAIVVKFHE